MIEGLWCDIPEAGENGPPARIIGAFYVTTREESPGESRTVVQRTGHVILLCVRDDDGRLVERVATAVRIIPAPWADSPPPPA